MLNTFLELNSGGGTDPRNLGGFDPLLTGSPLTLGDGDGTPPPEFCLLKLAKILPLPYSEMDGALRFFLSGSIQTDYN